MAQLHTNKFLQLSTKNLVYPISNTFESTMKAKNENSLKTEVQVWCNYQKRRSYIQIIYKKCVQNQECKHHRQNLEMVGERSYHNKISQIEINSIQ